ncbi:hypothetical protein BJ875DRAFT_493297 [Amylocarpus encephaloides]|uniref:BZIP domain-containing protein n=1 Tax=Amylocarpus encephaloides TaxID=45428 RepID=A0A9P7YPB7_9HELO|nr:hypothetical protein BJ875DRAFT_493297 [Amylocarpus encephaloides]
MLAKTLLLTSAFSLRIQCTIQFPLQHSNISTSKVQLKYSWPISHVATPACLPGSATKFSRESKEGTKSTFEITPTRLAANIWKSTAFRIAPDVKNIRSPVTIHRNRDPHTSSPPIPTKLPTTGEEDPEYTLTTTLEKTSQVTKTVSVHTTESTTLMTSTTASSSATSTPAVETCPPSQINHYIAPFLVFFISFIMSLILLRLAYTNRLRGFPRQPQPDLVQGSGVQPAEGGTEEPKGQMEHLAAENRRYIATNREMVDRHQQEIDNLRRRNVELITQNRNLMDVQAELDRVSVELIASNQNLERVMGDRYRYGLRIGELERREGILLDEAEMTRKATEAARGRPAAAQTAFGAKKSKYQTEECMERIPTAPETAQAPNDRTGRDRTRPPTTQAAFVTESTHANIGSTSAVPKQYRS